MFSGIIETIGTILKITFQQECKELIIKPHINFDDVAIGDSIAVNGVCLTVTEIIDSTFKLTAVPETLRLTNLNSSHEGSLVNLERSLKANQRISGHYVQGHVDGIAYILEIVSDQSNAWLVKFKMNASFAKYIVSKGYISIDGMSITVIATGQDWFTVTLIPHTQQVTIAQNYRVGTSVNIEVDIMGKYIEKFLGVSAHASSY